MSRQVIYRQLNKDYAYWIEKRRIGQQKGGHVAGLLSYVEAGQVKQNILFDAGLGTLEALADQLDDSFWDEPLAVFITHGHVDHHAELMILSEIYCQRRGPHIYDIRPPLRVFCTTATHKYLEQTHRYGYHGGNTLKHCAVTAGQPVQVGLFDILPLAVDHFKGAVIYRIEFELLKHHRIIIGWDLKTLPMEHLEQLRRPSLAFVEATTWTPLADDTGHTSIEDLASSGFLDGLQLQFQPEQEKYGAYLVHYSGWEDPWGMLTDAQLKQQFDETYPLLSNTIRVAKRDQQWKFA